MAASQPAHGSPTLAPNWLHAAQVLYDMDYVNGGFQGDPPPGTAVDDTFGTYSTNYLIFVVSAAAAVVVLLNPRAAVPYKFLASAFFALTGLGYGLAGLLHQFIHEDEEHMEHATLWNLSYILVLLGSLSLNLLINQMLFAKFEKIGETCRNIINAKAVLLSGTVIIVTTASQQPNLILTGVASLIVLLYAFIVYAMSCKWIQALAVTSMIAGMLIQVLLTPRCGDAGYPDGWVDCPLPAPHFNHNALFHLLYAIGLLILGIAMNVSPDVMSVADGFARLNTGTA